MTQYAPCFDRHPEMGSFKPVLLGGMACATKNINFVIQHLRLVGSMDAMTFRTSLGKRGMRDRPGKFTLVMAFETKLLCVVFQQFGLATIMGVMAFRTFPLNDRAMNKLADTVLFPVLMAFVTLLGRILPEVKATDHPMRAVTGTAILLPDRVMHETG